MVRDDAIRALEVIAADEARHADHAWTIISWCHQKDRAAVADALPEVMARIPAHEPPDDEPGSDGSLEPLGIAGRQLQRSVAERCLAQSNARVASLIGRS